jgi:hypothetical protein
MWADLLAGLLHPHLDRHGTETKSPFCGILVGGITKKEKRGRTSLIEPDRASGGRAEDRASVV